MKRNWLEWVILVVSVAAILGLAAYLGLQALTADDAPPVVVATVDTGAGLEGETGWSAPMTVRNDGDRAVRVLTLEATAEVAGSTETSSLTVDLLGPHSETDGTIGFSARPDGPVEVRVVSFEVP